MEFGCFVDSSKKYNKSSRDRYMVSLLIGAAQLEARKIATFAISTGIAIASLFFQNNINHSLAIRTLLADIKAHLDNSSGDLNKLLEETQAKSVCGIGASDPLL